MDKLGIFHANQAYITAVLQWYDHISLQMGCRRKPLRFILICVPSFKCNIYRSNTACQVN